MTSIQGMGRPARLSIEERTADGVRVVTVSGEIDHDTMGPVQEALLPPGAEAPQRVVADLSAVTFMDSSGINLFLAAHQQVSEDGGWLRVAGVQSAVQRVIDLVGLNLVIDCRPTVEQALAD
ncbi:STAS domain-containing protein [Streptomyces flavofungini]|uniref:STAS domain-containing protein n=1 Tax=Streptomyces flavofungini TaxID=68200 RepID=UPI0034DF2FA5